MNNGYSYFGARYYDSDLSVWLSVDPLADKFNSTSPFMYCVGNPVNLIDFNGMDTIIVNQKGRLSKPIPAEGDHVFVMGTNKERRKGKLDYDENRNLLSRHKTVSVDRNSIEINRNRCELFRRNTEINLTGEKGMGKGEELFDFFAKNTNVEWSYNSYFDTENHYNPEAILFTSHYAGVVKPSKKTWNILSNPTRYFLLFDIHSHPPNRKGMHYPNASVADIEYKNFIISIGHAYTVFQVYSNGKHINY